MSARTEDLPPPPRRSTQRRLLVYSALGLLALVIIAALIAFLYLRSEKFNRVLTIEIEKALEAYGLRAEIGEIKPELVPSAATLRNVKLFNRRTGQLIATIDRARASITIRDLFALRLRREIVFDRLELEGVDLWVVFDEQGRSNFQGLRRPPPLRRRITFDYSKLVGSLNRGAIHFIDQRLGLKGDLSGLAGEGRPIEGSDPPRISVRLASRGGSIVRNGRETAIESAELIGRVMESGAEIERLALRLSSGEVTISGRLDDWRSLRYQLDTQIRANLEEVLPLFTPDRPVATTPAPGAAPRPSFKGATNFSGSIEGEGAQWSLSGRMEADEMSAYGVTFRDPRVERVRLESRDGQWTFSAGQARARSITAEGVEITNASASNVKGTTANGQTRITSNQATVALIKTGKTGRNEFREITLRDAGAIHESGKGKGRWTFSSSLAQARSGVAGEIEIKDASASKLNATLIDGQTRITSDRAEVQQVKIGQVKIGRAKDGQSVFNQVTSRDLSATFGSDVNKGQWTFSIGQARARSGVAGGVELTNASASNVKGTVVDGRVQVASDQATVERAKTAQSEFKGITARDLAA
ncbi:MAG: hypothetical protein ACREA2_04405, partial [Blastocatellia bacterium]